MPFLDARLSDSCVLSVCFVCVLVCFVCVLVHVCTLQTMRNEQSEGVGSFAIILDLQVACGVVVERKRTVLMLRYPP